LRVSIAVLLLVLAAPAWAGPKVLARVNGVELTQVDFDQVRNEVVPVAAFHSLSPERMAYYRPKIIQRMIEWELLYQEAKRRGLEVPKKWLKKQRQKTIERLGGVGIFKRALKQWGLTERAYRRYLEKKYLVKELLRLEVKEKATVSDQEALQHYEANRGSYFRPEARRLRHILISVSPNATAEERAQRRALAEEVLKKAREGADFAELAWNYSDDPYRVKGGDLGLVHKGRLEPELEEAAFRLEVGQISGVIQSIYGYHIVKVEGRTPPEQLPFEAVKEAIKRRLRQKKEKALREALLSRLKEGAQIEVYEE